MFIVGETDPVGRQPDSPFAFTTIQSVPIPKSESGGSPKEPRRRSPGSSTASRVTKSRPKPKPKLKAHSSRGSTDSDSAGSAKSSSAAGSERAAHGDKTPFNDVLYSPSGYDMMNILLRVVTRPNPKIDLGMVDWSCAFTLCDTFARDTPIVYCSEGFEKLTGYTSQEVIGRNCRFLQSPHGIDAKQEQRLRRTGADEDPENGPGTDGDKDKTVDVPLETTSRQEAQHLAEKQRLVHLKHLIERREEAQTEITNYKKGGIPFTNILTTIPVEWGAPSDRLRYIVGFQIDKSTCFI
ncbi:hypothetical protein MBLNU459_g6386t1 [Dothideomycetes sp. NU459]